ncbi:hypothetical protein A3Q56_06026 [Intoshia linei]|uniref:Transmembrane protein n=1 Tax=Intoshia linei TaxID=1819745 RepID=A0A177AYI4_9BILA|nr:hypothetical protein A3Q56_06026 [Intoshia linei]
MISDTDCPEGSSSHMIYCQSKSHDSKLLHVEMPNNFKSINKNEYLLNEELKRQAYLKYEEEYINDGEQMVHFKSTIGLKFYDLFRSLQSFLFGLLAGSMFLFVLSIWIISVKTKNDFIWTWLYSNYSLTFGSILYLFMAASTIYTYDKYDVIKLSKKFIIKSITFQNGSLSCLLMTIAILLNLSGRPVEEKIYRAFNNTSCHQIILGDFLPIVHNSQFWLNCNPNFINFNESQTTTKNEHLQIFNNNDIDTQMYLLKIIYSVKGGIILLAWFLISNSWNDQLRNAMTKSNGAILPL